MDYAYILEKVQDTFNKANITSFKLYYGHPDFDSFKEKLSDIGIKVSNGLTKICLLNVDNEFVIKIPIEGEYDHWSRTPEFNRYYHNYCQLDTVIYKDISSEENKDFVDLFLPVLYIGKIYGLEIYIQKKVDFVGTKDIDASLWNTAEQFLYDSESAYSCTGDDTDLVVSLLDYFGTETTEVLFTLMNQYVIKDLHCANFGYIGNKPYIFDYSGYQH